MTRPTGPRGKISAALALAILLALVGPSRGATPAGPTVGAWATYRWISAFTQEVPVLVRREGPGGEVTWSVDRETMTPAPIFVTYAILRGDARTYTLQVVTQQSLDGPGLSVTQARIDRASGKALRTIIQIPHGVIQTPDGALLRPFRQVAVKGPEESVSVPAGTFAAVRAPYRDATVWVSDQVPAMGLVKATFPSGTLELVRSGTSGAKDLLRS